jgi:hypothetical protein
MPSHQLLEGRGIALPRRSHQRGIIITGMIFDSHGSDSGSNLAFITLFECSSAFILVRLGR